MATHYTLWTLLLLTVLLVAWAARRILSSWHDVPRRHLVLQEKEERGEIHEW